MLAVILGCGTVGAFLWAGAGWADDRGWEWKMFTQAGDTGLQALPSLQQLDVMGFNLRWRTWKVMFCLREYWADVLHLNINIQYYTYISCTHIYPVRILSYTYRTHIIVHTSYIHIYPVRILSYTPVRILSYTCRTHIIVHTRTYIKSESQRVKTIHKDNTPTSPQDEAGWKTSNPTVIILFATSVPVRLSLDALRPLRRCITCKRLCQRRRRRTAIHW